MKNLFQFTIGMLSIAAICIIIGERNKEIVIPPSADPFEMMAPSELPRPLPARKAEPKAEIAAPQSPVLQAVDLESRIFLSQEDKERKRKLQASLPVLLEVQSRLLDTSEAAFGEEAEQQRMRDIEYLVGALNWNENPLRQTAIEGIIKILERDVRELPVPEEAKLSMAGDAIELYAILLQVDRERASDLMARASAGQKKIFQFATNLNKKGV